MSWKQVCVVAILVAGSIGATRLGNKELALVLAGAGAGFATFQRDAKAGLGPKDDGGR